jgi:hypothetical protein
MVRNRTHFQCLNYSNNWFWHVSQGRLDYPVPDFINIRSILYSSPNLFDSRVIEQFDADTEIVYGYGDQTRCPSCS